MTFRLYALQRISAAILAPLILVHLAVIFYATSRGLAAAEILGRTRGSIGWGAYYALFVVLASVHGAIGVRSVMSDWTRLGGRALDVVMWGVGLLLLALGLRAIAALVMA